MALYSLICAEMPLRIYSVSHCNELSYLTCDMTPFHCVFVSSAEAGIEYWSCALSWPLYKSRSDWWWSYYNCGLMNFISDDIVFCVDFIITNWLSRRLGSLPQ